MTLVDRGAAIKAELLRITPLAIADLESPSSVLIVNGHPGMYRPDDVMSWGDIRNTQEPGPISSSNRGRDVYYDIDLAVSSFRGGGQEVADVAEARCQALCTAVEEYVRVTDTTVGGLVYWCFASSFEMGGTNNADVLAKGRVYDALVTFTARARVTN